MKNETARQEIESLDYYLQNHTDDYSEESHTAMMMAIKALEQQTSEDCISREAVLNGLANIAKAKAKSDAQKALMGRVMYFIEQLPSVTPRINLALTSKDCISREEVQDLISRWLSDYLLDETREALETINYKVGDMPSVTPERPKGKWIWDLRMGLHKCSVCSKFCDFDYLYCPNCGSYNGGEKE